MSSTRNMTQIPMKPIERTSEPTFHITASSPVTCRKQCPLPKLQIPPPARTTHPRERNTRHKSMTVPTPASSPLASGSSSGPASTSASASSSSSSSCSTLPTLSTVSTPTTTPHTIPPHIRTTELKPCRPMPYLKRHHTAPPLSSPHAFNMDDPASRTRGFDRYSPKELVVHCDCVRSGAAGTQAKCNHRARGRGCDVILDGEGNARDWSNSNKSNTGDRSGRSGRSGASRSRSGYEDGENRARGNGNDESSVNGGNNDGEESRGCCCTWSMVGACLCCTVISTYKLCCEE
ncbi:hypothetical protein BJ165DRAFT_437413 [Panaeolus papilionaceus]|nr:hypothetical protein BJ165DRAFT_437413 [Panaeolus papilionaceus]